MSKTLPIGLLLIIISFVLFLSAQTALATVETVNGCHKPYSSWLYPLSGYNLSGIVDIYWTGAEVELGEVLAYRLYFIPNDEDPISLGQPVTKESYTLDTTSLPEGMGNLTVESFDGYYPTTTSENININQSISCTPFDPSILEDVYSCSFTNFVDKKDDIVTEELTLDWLMVSIGILSVIIIIRRFK